MAVYPKTYGKEDFLKFLKKNNVNDIIISKFVELPDEVVRNGNTYGLYISSIWYSGGGTHYSFELNYYCEETIEYLFSSKVFNDVEVSINNLTCELMGINCFKRNK
jgi:hypothetical protein